MANELFNQSLEFVLLSTGYEVTLQLSNYILEKISTSYKLLNYNNKQYVVTNINKSLVMLYIFYSFSKIFAKNPEYVFNTSKIIDVASQQHWKFLTMLYASTDFVSLLKTPKMPLSTQIHHYGVILAMIITLLSKFNGPSLSKSLVIYGAFSSSAGLVNTYLGMRKILNKNSLIITILKKFSLISYILACSGNWIWQLKYLKTYLKQSYSLSVILKFLLNSGLLYSWIQDDLKLMKHLATN